MAIIREPDGVEFTVIPTRLTAKDRREISASIAERRRTHNHSDSEDGAGIRKAKAVRERLEVEALKLPINERMQLVQRLTDSLAQRSEPSGASLTTTIARPTRTRRVLANRTQASGNVLAEKARRRRATSQS